MHKSLVWLEGLPRFSVLKFNLYRAWLLLNHLVPEYRDFEVFFIAGSKGKGTVASTLAAILAQAGIAAGLVTSPHLLNLTERINFNGADINEETLEEYVADIRANLPELSQEYGAWIFGEIILAAAFMWFRDLGARTIVLEAGLGGRLDAGNLFRRPLATCITTVSLEHQDILGDTVAKIAREKAGVIKPATPLVTAAKGEALTVLRHRAVRLGAPVYSYPSDFAWQEERALALRLPDKTLALSTKFATEADKANTAMAACLATFHPLMTDKAIVEGIKSSPRLPGRFEVLLGRPAFVLDVAHTPESVANLQAAIVRRHPGGKLAFVAGFLADKRATEMLAIMLSTTELVYWAPVLDQRSFTPEGLSGGIQVDSISEGIRAAMSQADVVCITGSFAAVREARLFLSQRG